MTIPPLRLLAVALMPFLLAAGPTHANDVAAEDGSLDAQQILKRTQQVYRDSQSYVDTGVVVTEYKNSRTEWTGETRFKTAYVAPIDFHFESIMDDFQTIEVQFLVGSDEKGVRAWMTGNPERFKYIGSVQEALDTGAGITRDASGMIPGLFFAGTKLGGDIVRLTDAVRLADEEIDGFDCFQVRGFRWPNTGRPTTVWIDKDSFLIRQVYEEQMIKGDLSKTTWSYKPALNVTVDEAALRYETPSP